MKTDRPFSLAKMSFFGKKSTYIYFIIICLALTVKVSAQDIDNVDKDAEERKAKLKSLLSAPPSSSALPRTNAQQIPNKSSVTSTTPSVQSSVLTTTNLANRQIPSTVRDKENKLNLIKFLESRRNKNNNATVSPQKSLEKNMSSQELVSGCSFDIASGTLNCNQGLDFFDVNLAISQTLQNLDYYSNTNENSVELSRIDVFSCNIPIVFKLLEFYANITKPAKNGDDFEPERSLRYVQTLGIVSSKVENIEDGAFDLFSETLIQLDLSNNKLDRIPSAIFRLRHLIDLDLSGNQISQLPALPANLVEAGSFRNLVSLSSLNLGNNR